MDFRKRTRRKLKARFCLRKRGDLDPDAAGRREGGSAGVAGVARRGRLEEDDFALLRPPPCDARPRAERRGTRLDSARPSGRGIRSAFGRARQGRVRLRSRADATGRRPGISPLSLPARSARRRFSGRQCSVKAANFCSRFTFSIGLESSTATSRSFRFAIVRRSSMIAPHGGTFQGLRTGSSGGEMVCPLAGGRLFPGRSGFAEAGLLDRHSAAECHRRAHPRARLEQHHPGHSRPPRAHAGQGSALAAGNGSRRDRDADVVERQLRKEEGKTRHDLGREDSSSASGSGRKNTAASSSSN